MTLEELIRRFRTLSTDRVAPYLFASEDVTDWLNEAEAQACVRARLLLDDATAAVCEIALEPGVHSYALHPRLYELVNLRVTPAEPYSRPLALKSREWLDARVRDWRELQGDIRYAVQGETTIRLVGMPSQPGMLHIEGYRLPLQAMEGDDDTPEIHLAHHDKLIQWALHRAFSIPDSEGFDPDRAKLSEAEFTAYFGPSPDADLRRITREHEVQHNVVHPF